MENFIPSACEDPRCSFSALAVLNEDGCLIPATHIDWVSARGTDAAEKSIAYVRRHWKYPASGKSENGANNGTPGIAETSDVSSAAENSSENLRDPALERIRNYSLCISGMAFQDAWNIELDRLRRCCVHVAAPGNNKVKMVPFCAYYLRLSS